MALLLALLGAGIAWPEAEAQTSLEYAVKAAYLVKFAPFIDWPQSAFPSPTAPVSICVVGHDPFGDLLDRAAAGERDGERPIVIRRAAAPGADCQIVFAANDATAGQSTEEAVKGRPVVTVTDSGNPARGMISFVIADNHVRFDIDEAAADAASIHISSKLLGLAHAVKKEGRP